MKKTYLFLFLVFSSIFAKADLGSAEIYFIKSDYTFDFLSLDHQGLVRLNKNPGSSANLNDMISMKPEYFKICFEGALEPVHNLIVGLVHNTPNATLEDLVELPNRKLQVSFTVQHLTQHLNQHLTQQLADSVSPIKFEIQSCDF